MKRNLLAVAVVFTAIATPRPVCNQLAPSGRVGLREPSHPVLLTGGGTHIPWPTCATTGVDTAAEFITFSDCYFRSVLASTLARRSPADQARASGYASLFQSSVSRLTDFLLTQGLPTVSPSDLQTFEASLPLLMSELDAYNSVFDPNLPPPSPLTVSDWQDHQQTAQEQTSDTLAAKIKWFIALLPESIQPYASTLIDIVLEIIKVFF